jgi:hypothetical protein
MLSAVVGLPWWRTAESFVQARTSDECCGAWLDLICGELDGARTAAILVEGTDAQTFARLAACDRHDAGRSYTGPRGVVPAIPAEAPADAAQVVVKSDEPLDVTRCIRPALLKARR